jgi:hypothetical protein
MVVATTQTYREQEGEKTEINRAMEAGRASLLGLPDDALLCVLSFLGPKDLFL